MKPISGKRMCKLVEDNGWTLARVTGSHHVYVQAGSNVRITIPVHGNKDLKIGLQTAIMKMAGIAADDL